MNALRLRTTGAFFSLNESFRRHGGFTWFPTKQAMPQFFLEIAPPAMDNEQEWDLTGDDAA